MLIVLMAQIVLSDDGLAASGETREPDVSIDEIEYVAGWERNRIVLGTTAAGVAGVTAWGVANWDYFSRSPQAKSEGWFGPDTPEGGMDKLGHLYTTYLMSHGFAYLYEHWDFEHREAAFCGCLTSFAIMGYMEFGDSFSDYGFSYEDLVMNGLGAVLGYLLYTRPALAGKVDLRWQIGLQPTQADVLTDYENSKFLVALKLNGFETFRRGALRHVELHAGYYVEGFGEAGEPDYRHPYLGIGVNLTDLLFRQGWPRCATVLRYLQLPYTSLNHDFDL